MDCRHSENIHILSHIEFFFFFFHLYDSNVFSVLKASLLSLFGILLSSVILRNVSEILYRYKCLGEQIDKSLEFISFTKMKHETYTSALATRER